MNITTANPAHEDSAPFIPQGGAVVNTLTGLLSKAADTALDIYALKSDNNRIVGTMYPTGQQDPAAALSEKIAEKKNEAITGPDRQKMILYGALALAGVALVITLARK